MVSVLLDILFVVFLVIFIFSGFRRGLIRSLIRSFQIILSSFAAYLFGEPLGAFLRQTFADPGTSSALAIPKPLVTPLFNLLGYAILFFGSLIFLTAAAYFLSVLTDKIPVIGKVNHILGGVWGGVTAFVILLIFISVLKVFFGNDPLYSDTVFVKALGEWGTVEAFDFLNVGNILT